ncbi:DsbA family protein, partial [Streptomyces flavovirens]
PTLMMDGKKITTEGSDNAPMTDADFNTASTAALKG